MYRVTGTSAAWSPSKEVAKGEQQLQKMYKTVRHGENSLQYKILAQQEEGLPGKRPKSPKAFILKFIAIVTLLIILIMASAFLVPLLLANDFIAVTGTFQKFSVSTLRRSHSGNHVVVIAKKPYGWNAPHPTIPSRLSNTSHAADNDAEKAMFQKPPTVTRPPQTTTEPTTTTRSTVRTTAEVPKTTRTTATVRTAEETTATAEGFSKGDVPFYLERYKLTTNPADPERPIGSQRENDWGWVEFPPTKTNIQQQQQQSLEKETAEGEVISSKLNPLWFKPHGKGLNFESSEFGKAGDLVNPLLVIAGFVIVAVIICFVASRILCRRTTSEKETPESKEDKRKLLKPAASSDHDDE